MHGSTFPAQASALVGGGAPNAVDPSWDLEKEVHDARPRIGHEVASHSRIARSAARDIAVEGKDDRIDDGGLSRTRGTFEEKEAARAERIEIEFDFLPERPDALETQMVKFHGFRRPFAVRATR